MNYKSCTNYNEGKCTGTSGSYCPRSGENMCIGEMGAMRVLESANCFTTDPKVNKYKERMKEIRG